MTTARTKLPQERRPTDSERARRSMQRRLDAGAVHLKLIVPRSVHERLKRIAQTNSETQAQTIARLVGLTGAEA